MKSLEERLYTPGDIATEVNQWGQSMTDEEVLSWLRLRGYLIAIHGEEYNRPSELSLLHGYMKQIRSVSVGTSGCVLITTRPVFTAKGRDFILPRILYNPASLSDDLRH